MFQLVKSENITAVISMNEDYELRLFSNDAEVIVSSGHHFIAFELGNSNNVFH